MLRLLSRLTVAPQHSTFSTSAALQKGGRKERKFTQVRKRRETLDKLKLGTHRKRLDTLASAGRSTGGKTQRLEAQMRRSRASREKFDSAREHVQRVAGSEHERRMAEARILRQRSRELKSRRAPGIGFTPARFRLTTVENEAHGKAAELAARVREARFDGMGLRAEVVDAVGAVLGADARPSEIQALGVGEVLTGKSVFLAAETGTGKTLAYALPIVSRLRQEEADGRKRRERRPRAVVIVPSRELVGQVAKALKGLAHTAKLRVAGIHLGLGRRRVCELVKQGPIDILVSTPGAVLRFMSTGDDQVLTPADAQTLVVDEADSMLDEHSFGSQTTRVIQLIQRANATQARKEQAVFVSATLPKLVREQIIRLYPDVVHVTTPTLHRTPHRLAQSFVDVSREFQGHKLNALVATLRASTRDKRILVFCNTKISANVLHRQLFRKGIPSLLLVGGGGSATGDSKNESKGTSKSEAKDGPKDKAKDGPKNKANDESNDEPKGKTEDEAKRSVILGAATADHKAAIPAFDHRLVLESFSSDEPIPRTLLPQGVKSEEPMLAGSKILVCTDLAARGIDFKAMPHVVLFDFPTTAIDFLHRAGRTARARTRGKLTALVSKKDRRMADQISLTIKQGGVVS